MMFKKTILTSLFLSLVWSLTANAQVLTPSIQANIIPNDLVKIMQSSGGTAAKIGQIYTQDLEKRQVAPVEKVVLPLSVATRTEANSSTLKRTVTEDISTEWSTFRKESGWLWTFFKENLTYKQQVAIKENLEKQKVALKGYLEEKNTLFDIYEVIGELEVFIQESKKEDFNSYMDEKIELLKEQKQKMVKVKEALALDLVKTTIMSKVDFSSPTLIENTSKKVIDAIKILPEEKQIEIAAQVIEELKINNTNFSKILLERISAEFLISIPTNTSNVNSNITCDSDLFSCE